MLHALLLVAFAHADDAPTYTFETYNLGLAHGFVDHAAARTPALLEALQADLRKAEEVVRGDVRIDF